MAAKTEEQPGARKLEVGTVVDAYGSVYELRFPATFHPSKDNPATGWMIDPWGSRKFITLVQSGYDKPPASARVSRHRCG
jgi:hypothetical protein